MNILENPEDIVGERFDRLFVLKYIGKKTRISQKSKKINNEMFYLCLCDCGNTKEIMRYTLLTKHNYKATSCGCKSKENREILKKSKNYTDISLKTLYVRYRTSANKRNIEFDLQLDTFKKIVFSNCYICGDAPSAITKAPNNNKYAEDILYNGIDRLDPQLGYNIGNCQPCCKRCNYSKFKMNLKDFKEYILNVSERIKNNIF